MVEERTVPQQSLARLFPQGFPEFWAKLEFKKDLEQVIYSYTPATLTHEEIKKTLASGGYGLGAPSLKPTPSRPSWKSVVKNDCEPIFSGTAVGNLGASKDRTNFPPKTKNKGKGTEALTGRTLPTRLTMSAKNSIEARRMLMLPPPPRIATN
ncbi:20394_t:CDS:2 [Entrophospora sp. SA101]|nr:20394_t:CDS:2 [Entrophospora sp. SA101]